MLGGAIGLFVSLFLTWSHQLPRPVLDAVGASPVLRGVPADPTAWQVYSAVDVLLALLAASLVAVAVLGASRRVRVALLVAAGIGLAFAVHARSVPPTNGALIVNPAAAPAYLHDPATPGTGETVAIIALGLAGAGLGLSLARG
jgi:hypothetical protein